MVVAKSRERVVCAGNAGLDRTFAVSGPVAMATSNPAQVRTSFGGVARNIAENLARLGVDVALVTQVGDDAPGRALRDDCRACGIDVAGIVFSPLHPTSEYVAIIDPHSELVIGASSTAAIDALTVGRIGTALPDDTRTAWTFGDCNLPAPVLAALLEDRRAGGPQLAIDAVSIAKVQRLPRDLNGIDVLFLNADEACALLAREVPEAELAAGVRARGAAAAVVTRGARGAVVATAAGTVELAAPKAVPVDVTGAGDALIAGTLHGLLQGETLPDAVRTGMLAALLTIEAPATVSRSLSRIALETARARVSVRA